MCAVHEPASRLSIYAYTSDCHCGVGRVSHDGCNLTCDLALYGGSGSDWRIERWIVTCKTTSRMRSCMFPIAFSGGG